MSIIIVTMYCRKCDASITTNIANATTWDTLHSATCEQATTIHVVMESYDLFESTGEEGDRG